MQKSNSGVLHLYCGEEIRQVYLGQPKYSETGDCFLDCYCDLALYITPNYRIILECNSCFISLQTDGVHKINKSGGISDLEKENEWIESYYHIEDDPEDSPWVDYEFTLFTGERIVDVSICKNGYDVQFTDFKLKVVPYPAGSDVFRFVPAAYSKVLGTERLINKCSCGGTGILVIDFVYDYGIRCDRCHKGTSAATCAIDAIEEWKHAPDSLYQIGEYPAEAFQKCCFGKIDYIAIAKWYHEYDDNLLDCDTIIIKVNDKLFEIGSCYSGQRNYDFSVEEFSDFNTELWPRKIVSTPEEPIRFIRKETEPDSFPVLRFEIGYRPLLVTANETNLTVGLSHWDAEGNWVEFENNCLLNDA